jgi:hypothetical protein
LLGSKEDATAGDASDRVVGDEFDF